MSITNKKMIFRPYSNVSRVEWKTFVEKQNRVEYVDLWGCKVFFSAYITISNDAFTYLEKNLSSRRLQRGDSFLFYLLFQQQKLHVFCAPSAVSTFAFWEFSDR